MVNAGGEEVCLALFTDLACAFGNCHNRYFSAFHCRHSCMNVI